MSDKRRSSWQHRLRIPFNAAPLEIAQVGQQRRRRRVKTVNRIVKHRLARAQSRYGTEVGITDWINPQSEPQLGLSPDFVTWPKLLEQAGYVNALIGKWHLGTQDRFLPRHFGFQYFMGFREGSSAPKDPEFEIEGQLRRQSGFNGNLLTDDAIRFIRNHQEKNFCLLLNFREPHTPRTPMPDEDTAPYQQLDPTVPNPDYPNLDVARVKRMMREYLADVTNIDRNVGRLLAALDELKLSEKTVVVFTSDHGYNIGHHGILHKSLLRSLGDRRRASYEHCAPLALKDPQDH